MDGRTGYFKALQFLSRYPIGMQVERKKFEVEVSKRMVYNKYRLQHLLGAMEAWGLIEVNTDKITILNNKDG